MLEVFEKGGFVMYPILICSLAAVTIFFERMFYLKSIKTKSKKFVLRVKNLVKKGSIEMAISACRKSPTPISKIMLAGLMKFGRGRDEIKEAVEDSANQEIPVLEGNLSTLSTVGNITPLLGLLGTVFGMIKAFNVISIMGVSKPELLAGGISEALLTTAFGLSIAIPTVVIYNYLSHRVDKLIREMEVNCVELIDLLTYQEINSNGTIRDSVSQGGEAEYEISSSE
ncbi:MotA/TolQ/ExbB proton channel family protein [bacterium]|nr:MotA/TolQ/ExbB proton channel family protein [bacterium]MBU4362103.1 MotA/TolQ/ExbB proton channel family protein [bacterium]MBU4602568.1 MotA/TolQ/ExbB proton channel family protein [bacterium]MCG2762219.1 MotA/TolQ/ExbB proton channel family protein [Candidatus Atribacteria bacterium]